MTERDILMNKIATIDFALVDMHLFLDTHPNNTAIAKKISEYEENDDERKTFLYNPNGAHGGIGDFIVRDCRSSAPGGGFFSRCGC